MKRTKSNKINLKKNFCLFFLLSSLFSYGASLKQREVYSVKNIIAVTVNSSINPATLSYLQSAYEKAQNLKNPMVLIRLNTPGGLVPTTKDILTIMGQLPTVVWITPEAASATSAGAIIASASHFLFMSKGTNIGAATPVQMGKDLGKDLRNKAINDLVALITSLSEARGRNAKMFANMIEKASSYRSEEAKDKNIIDGIADDLSSVIKQINGKNFALKGKDLKAEIKEHELIEFPMDLGQQILNVLAHPSMAYILFLIGAALIYLEFQAPGAIVPGAAGAFFLILAGIGFQLLPLNFGALALIILAFTLFIAEIFVTSFGILSFAGLCAFLFGSLFLFSTNDSYIELSFNLVIACTFSIALFLLIMGFTILRDFKRKKSKIPIYSQKGKTAVVIKAFGYDQEQEKFLYFVRVDGEIWQASSEHSYKKGKICKVLEAYKENMKLKI